MLVRSTVPCPHDKVILPQPDHSQPMPKLQALVVDLQMETPTAIKHNKHFQAVTLHHKVVACQDLEDCLEEVDPQEVVVDHLDMEDPL